MQKDNADLQKVTLNLFEGDMEKLRSFYPDVGASAVIRRAVRRLVEQIEANGSTTGVIEVDIDL